MKHIQNSKMFVSFDEGILFVRFLEGADSHLADVKTIMAFAKERSHGKPFCILFDPSAKMFNTSDEALQYVIDNPENLPILAKAYILRSKEMQTAAKLHMSMDHPKIKPHFFDSEEAARAFLKTFLKDVDLHHDFTDDKVHLEFADRIFYIKYNEAVTVDETDLREIYDWVHKRAKGRTFGVVLDHSNTYTTTEAAIAYQAHSTHNNYILGKAFVTKDPAFRANVKMHNMFDDPDIKIKLFETKEEAFVWIQSLLSKK